MANDPVFTLPISGSPVLDSMPTTDINSSNWLAPSTVCSIRAEIQPWTDKKQVAFNDDYMTPFPTTQLDSHPWTQFTKPLMPHHTIAPPVLGTSFPAHHYAYVNSLNRPRSSPSTFGPGPDTYDWPVSSGLGIHYPPDLPPVTVPGDLFAGSDIFSRDTPELKAPVPRRPYQVIAPNPAGIPTKRGRDEDGLDVDSSMGKRRRRAASVSTADLTDDDRYLVQLKEDENLPWKEIATRFSTDKGKSFQVPALQMRYKRLREKFRIWEEQDVHALKLANEYWTKYKWEIISQKMTEFGSPERWPARSCARKWQEIELTTASSLAAASAGITPALTQYAGSPIHDGPMHFAFLPIS
ncbi:hypothetical protein AMS68_003991 [Peltaster fructicola]|uniref:Myb-like domain-containing protein n=1 Tax=Peltaster fructicola TaxID=286661 RepID=A0A6H0XUR5_9PEZI|nr:hypothetical protein AMS68_003991 [Peltaster fructicola]